jgi:hypothetical protein
MFSTYAASMKTARSALRKATVRLNLSKDDVRELPAIDLDQDNV